MAAFPGAADADAAHLRRDVVLINLWGPTPEEISFGQCYHCADGRHRECIGVPCGCACAGETTMNCELCGKPGEMKVSVLLPSFGAFVNGAVCMQCWSESEGDLEMATALMKKRAEVRGITLPVQDQETLFSLFEPEG